MTISHRNELEQRLDIYKRNRSTLEIQLAEYGGRISAPLALINQLDNVTREIELLQREISRLPPDSAFYFNMWTYIQGNMYFDHCHNVDLTAHFLQQIPNQETWYDHIAPVVSEFTRHCNNQRFADIVGYLYVTPAVAIALGSMFQAPSRYTLWIMQRTGSRNEWWHSNASPDETDLPLVQIVEGAGNDAVVEVGVVPNQHTGPAVTTTINRLGLSVGYHVSIAFDNPQSEVRDVAHAIAIARQVRQQLLNARYHVGSNKIHLFLATPVALAVFIGTLLNTCSPIQCYEYRRERRDYVPACLL